MKPNGSTGMDTPFILLQKKKGRNVKPLPSLNPSLKQLSLLQLTLLLLSLLLLHMPLELPFFQLFPSIPLLYTKEAKLFPVQSLKVNLLLGLLSMQVISDTVFPIMAMVGVTVLELHILLFLPQLPPLLPKHLQLLMSERNVKLMPRPRLRLILKLGITVIMDTIWAIMAMAMALGMADTMVDTTDIPMDMDITDMANKQIKPKCKL